MCLASCAIELATNSDATSAMITASTVAPPPKLIPMGIENAVAMAGAMKVIDWNRTPPKPTAPRRSSHGRATSGDEGTPTVAMHASLWRGPEPHEVYARRHPASTGGLP